MAATGQTPPVIMGLEDVDILHVIHNDVAQALVQMDIRPKEDILQNIANFCGKGNYERGVNTSHKNIV